MQSLADLGEEVMVFSVADSDTEKDLAAWAPLSVVTVPGKGPRRFGYAPDLERQLEAFNPDVVHTHGLWTYTSVVSSRWQRRTGRPVIIHPHGMLDPWAVRNAAWKKRVAGWLFEYRHLRNAACLRALCDSEADAIRAFGLKNPVAVIPNGMDLPDLVESSSLRVDGITSQLSTAVSQPQAAASPRTLLYLGRIHPKKGLANLIRAWAVAYAADARRQKTEDSDPSSVLRPATPIGSGPTSDFDSDLSAHSSLHPSYLIPHHSPAPWRLAIAGWEEGGHEAELKRLCNELGLAWNDARDQKAKDGGHTAASVSFLGPQFGEAKAACYRECDAFVLPSFSEGLPMVVLEAWAYGKPVLMTPECNLPEGFAAGAAIRIETNVESIAAGLRKLFALSASSSHSSPLTPHTPSAGGDGHPSSGLSLQASDLVAMGARGRELVRTRFTWPKIAADLRDVYTWLLGKGAKPECVRGKF